MAEEVVARAMAEEVVARAAAPHADASPRLGLQRRPVLVLAPLMALFGALYLYLLRDVGIGGDEWTWLLYLSGRFVHYSSFATLTAPYNRQPIVGDLLIYRAWAGAVGVAHHWVLHAFLLALELAVALLVYAMARRRVDTWLALVSAVLVLVMGRAWQTLLYPASLNFVIPTLALCTAWFALDRRVPVLVWPLVGVLLAFASVSGGLGVVMAIALLAELVYARRWRALWLVVAVVAPLAAWWLHEHPTTGLPLGSNLRHLPLWAGRYLSAAAGATIGLPTAGGLVLLALAVVVLAAAIRRAGPGVPEVSPRLIGLLSAVAGAVVITGAARASSTPPAQSRYLYFPAVVMILLAGELAHGLGLRRRSSVAIAAASAATVACILGVQQFRDGKVQLKRGADASIAQMSAMLLVGAPSHWVQPGGLAYSPPVLHLFIRRFGRAPFYSEHRIAQALPASRAAVDGLLAHVDLMRGGFTGHCTELGSGGALPVHGTTLLITTPTVHQARVWRFADPASAITIPVLPPRTVFSLRGDALTRPWRVFAPGARARTCA